MSPALSSNPASPERSAPSPLLLISPFTPMPPSRPRVLLSIAVTLYLVLILPELGSMYFSVCLTIARPPPVFTIAKVVYMLDESVDFDTVHDSGIPSLGDPLGDFLLLCALGDPQENEPLLPPWIASPTLHTKLCPIATPPLCTVPTIPRMSTATTMVIPAYVTEASPTSL